MSFWRFSVKVWMEAANGRLRVRGVDDEQCNACVRRIQVMSLIGGRRPGHRKTAT
jgi:hypothetical protein